jgi:hypothetical protein
MKEAICSSETSDVTRVIQRHITEIGIPLYFCVDMNISLVQILSQINPFQTTHCMSKIHLPIYVFAFQVVSFILNI